MLKKRKTSALDDQSLLYDEPPIDLARIYNKLARHWKLIALCSILPPLAMYLYLSITGRKPYWRGTFAMLIGDSENSSSALSQINPALAGMIGIRAGSGGIETKLRVLKSPSVLMPVFQYATNSFSKSDDNNQLLEFQSWVNSQVEIESEKGSSIITVSYKTRERNKVLPVLDKITSAFKRYSTAERERGLNNAASYLKSEIANRRLIASISNREAQVYAVKNGLGLPPGADSAAGVGNTFESERSAALNLVSLLEKQLSYAKKDRGSLLFRAPKLDGNMESLFSQYQRLQVQLSERRSRLKNSDPIVRDLERQLTALRATINKETVSLLEGQLSNARARLSALSRPESVLIKHRELVRKAVRDEQILSDLEKQLQLTLLEKAKSTSSPFEVISPPVLQDKPLSTDKRGKILIAMLIGFVLSCVAAIAKDKSSNIIFDKDELLEYVPDDCIVGIGSMRHDRIPIIRNILDDSTEELRSLRTYMLPIGMKSHETDLFSSVFHRSTLTTFDNIGFTPSESVEILLVVAFKLGSGSKSDIALLGKLLGNYPKLAYRLVLVD